MTVWSIQTLGAWNALRRTGRLRGDGRRGWRHFRSAYGWMREQMIRRNLLRESRHPVWLWCESSPDLRQGALLSQGHRGVRLTLEVAQDRVLRSHFQAWHCVLNRGYLALSEREDNRFEATCRRRTGKSNPRWEHIPGDLRNSIRRSWERIFELRRLGASPLWRTRDGSHVVQGTMAEIRLADLRRVDHFIAR